MANSAPITTAAEVETVSHIRLPGFWRQAPQHWFTHADAMFANKRIRSDLTRVNHVLEALDEDGVKTISDLLGSSASYDEIRRRIISTYAVPQATRFRNIVQPGGMGDRTPSRLLRDMRDVYPEDMGDSALEQFWRQKLPSAVRTVIAGMTESLDVLAERADRIMEACAGTEISTFKATANQAPATSNPTVETDPTATHEIALTTAQTPNETRFHALEKALLALTTQVASLAATQAASFQNAVRERTLRGQRIRPRSQSRSRAPPAEWCFYHERFGTDARTCREPCSYESTQNN